MKDVDIYVCSSLKDDKGAWCAILAYGTKTKELTGTINGVTSIVLEMTAVINGLEALKESCNVNIYCRNETLNSIARGKWNAHKHMELWNKLFHAAKPHKTEWIRTYDMDNIPLDQKAHSIAISARKSLQ